MEAAVRQADGKLVVVGRAGGDPFVARFLADGELDQGFAQGGVRILPFGPEQGIVNDVAVQPDGALIVAGTIDKIETFGNAGVRDLFVARLDPVGTVDPGFGSGGVTRLATNMTGQYFDAEAVELAADGAILVVGNTGLSHRESANFPIVVRLRSDGTPDPTIGSLRPGVLYFGPR